MQSFDIRSYSEIESPFWRRLVTATKSIWVRLPLGLLHTFAIVPASKVLRFDPDRFHPIHLEMLAYDLAVGTQRCTPSWNQQIVRQVRLRAAASQARRKWLETNAVNSSDLLLEKEQIVAQMTNILERNDHWTVLDDPQQRALECAHVLDRIDEVLQVNAVALFGEGIRRQLDGIELHETQYEAVFCLIDGYFVEMRNGEGKTFVSVPVLGWAALRLQALRIFAEGKGISLPFDTCFYFTANDYLVRRDFIWLKSIYESLGVSISFLQSAQKSTESRREAYAADIVCIAGTDFGFDCLRNSCREYGTPPIKQSAYLTLVDECDQLLLDESSTPLILSGSSKLRQSAFVETAWVWQVNRWVKEIYLENQLFRIARSGNYELTMAGRIYVRTILDEWDIRSWADFRKLLQNNSGLVWISFLIQTILIAPMLRAQLTPDVAAQLEGILTETSGELLRQDPKSGKLFLTSKGIEVAQLLSGSFVDTGTLKEIWSYVNSQILAAQAALSVEDLQFLGKAKRRILPILLSLIRGDNFVSELVEFVCNAIAESSIELNLSPSFLEGLCQLQIQRHGQPSKLTVANWLVEDALPTLGRLMLPVVSATTRNLGSGMQANLYTLVRVYSIFAKLDHKAQYESHALRSLVQEVAMVGALLQNFLFLPESGALTNAGRAVAEFLEHQCRAQNLSERFSPSGIVALIEKSLHSYFGLVQDKHYIVKDNCIILVNQITGRREPSKHFGRSIHPFVQAKHGISVEEPLPTKRTVTVQNLVTQMPRLVGMSGTILSQEGELRELYSPKSKKPIAVGIQPCVPPKLRQEGFVIASSKEMKWRALSDEILERSAQSSQPILVITASVQDSNKLAEALLTMANERHKRVTFALLNAQREEIEEEVVSWAGQLGAITIATQMAARGTDIVVTKESVDSGGLYVIVAEIHELSRLDAQAEGRTARHGDPGCSRFYASFEDSLMRDAVFTPKVREVIARLLGTEVATVDSDGAIASSFRAIQDKNQLDHQRRRKLTMDVDSAVAPFRTDGNEIRELFVKGSQEDVLKGIAVLIEIYLEDATLDTRLITIASVAQEMAQDISKLQADASALALKFGARLAFPLVASDLENVLRVYSTQQTPNLTLSESAGSFPIVQLLENALVDAARRADLETISGQWHSLVERFKLGKTFAAPQWKELLEHLHKSLALGLNWRAQEKINELFDKLIHRQLSAPCVVSELMRQALVEFITKTDPRVFIRTTPVGRWDVERIGPESTNVFGAQISGNSREEVYTSLIASALAIFDGSQLNSESFCREFLDLYDELWEKAIDDTQLVEMRCEREGAASWSTQVRDVCLVFHGFFRELALRSLKLLEHFGSRTPDSAPPRRAQRKLPATAIAPHWFQAPGAMDEYATIGMANSSEPPVAHESGDENHEVNEGNLPREQANEENHVEDCEEESGKPQSTSTGSADSVRELVEIDFERLVALVRQQDNLSVFDTLVCGEAGNRSDEEWLQCAEVFRRIRDGLSAIACLDMVSNQEQTALFRSLIFEAYGCHENELKYLRKLMESGKLTRRLKLRLTYLLSQRSIADRKEAANIVFTEGVPDQSLVGTLTDYSPLEALQTGLAQLQHLHEYDAVVGLFLNKVHIVSGKERECCSIFDTLAESLPHSSRELQARFCDMMGCEWRVWLRQLFVAFYEDKVLGSPFLARHFLRLCLFSDDIETASLLVRKLCALSPGADVYLFLAESFRSCGLEFEERLFKARALILCQEYESADEETRWLLNNGGGDDSDVLACRVYSLLGLSRCLGEFLFWKDRARKALSECLQLLQKLPLTPIDNTSRQMEIEVLCRLENWADAKLKIDQLCPTNTEWRVHALLGGSLEGLTDPKSIEPTVDSVRAEGYAEALRACYLVNNWFRALRGKSPNVWKSQDSWETLSRMRTRWQNVLAKEGNYQGFHELGRISRLMADWQYENGNTTAAKPELQCAIGFLRDAIPLTHEANPPYKSTLRREDTLLREEMEVVLRQSLRRIKSIEGSDNP